MWNYVLREGFSQISADTNFSIYPSASLTFHPQSGPDVTRLAGSCIESVSPVSAHNIAICIYYHLTLSHTHHAVRESFKAEVSPAVKLCKTYQNTVKVILFIFLQVWLEPIKPVAKQVRSKWAQILAQSKPLMMCVGLLMCVFMFFRTIKYAI